MTGEARGSESEISMAAGSCGRFSGTARFSGCLGSAARVIGADAFISKRSFGELVIAVRRLIENSGPLGRELDVQESGWPRPEL